MTIRTATIRLVNINSVGDIVYKTGQIIDVISNINNTQKVFEYETGSAPNAASDNARTAPSIHEYLSSEDNDGYQLIHMDQFFIITKL